MRRSSGLRDRRRRRSSPRAAGRRGSGATSSSGFWVALRPIRCSRRPRRPALPSASRRSSVSARCEPRLEAATAWISSTITAWAPVEHRAGLGGEDQVQRLGGRDEDVRRVAGHRGALALGRVAGADPDPDLLGADPPQGRPQVALDVVGEGLQRADVDARACPRRGCCLGDQPVERPQERGQRLARAGGGGHAARARRGRSPARPAPGRGWARRRRSRTSGGWRVRSTPGPSWVQAICSPRAAPAGRAGASLWAPEWPASAS